MTVWPRYKSLEKNKSKPNCLSRESHILIYFALGKMFAGTCWRLCNLPLKPWDSCSNPGFWLHGEHIQRGFIKTQGKIPPCDHPYKVTTSLRDLFVKVFAAWLNAQHKADVYYRKYRTQTWVDSCASWSLLKTEGMNGIGLLNIWDTEFIIKH